MVDAIALRASETVFELAESPLWNPDSHRVLWVDIPTGRVHSGTLRDSTIVDTRSVELGEPITAACLARDGGLLVSTQRRLVAIDGAGDRHLGPDILPAHRRNRMNDGACDSAGRYLVGTLSLDGEKFAEELLQVEPDGTVTAMRSGIGLSNGIAWSPDGARLYHVDTMAHTVWVAEYDVASGVASEWSELFVVDGEYPDGLAVDVEGMLWVAMWGAGQVRRYDTAGRIHTTVRVDAPHTSSVAFVGPDLDRLLITTATSELSKSERDATPDSGAIFIADPGVKGMPANRWGGSTSNPHWGKTGGSASVENSGTSKNG
ncbi:MAG: SMP-30/gluconolactonase/LRE family protein [Micrococcales bacterium]|nr:SMP-30/gluconolactonase/LRE family protein [Micrococcales bacterium]